MPSDGFWNIQTASTIAVLCIFCTSESSLSGEPAPQMYKVELRAYLKSRNQVGMRRNMV